MTTIVALPVVARAIQLVPRLLLFYRSFLSLNKQNYTILTQQIAVLAVA